MDKALARSQHLQSETEENWNSLRATTYDTALSVLGKLGRKHQDWFKDRNQKVKDLFG